MRTSARARAGRERVGATEADRPSADVARLDRLKRPSLIDLIVLRIQEEFLGERGKPGTALPPERELAERYGVNRTSVRHALLKLESLGLIDTLHGIGSLIADYTERGGAELLKLLLVRRDGVDLELLGDLLEVRAAVGGEIARLAATRAQRDDLAALERALTELSARLTEPAAVQLHENAFVRALTRATGNRAFLFLANSLSGAYREHLPIFEAAFADTHEVERQLREVLNAVAARDAKRADRAFRSYLEWSGERMVSLLSTNDRTKSRRRG